MAGGCRCVKMVLRGGCFLVALRVEEEVSGGIAEVCGSANAVDAALSVSSHANAVVVQDAKIVPVQTASN